MVGQAEAGMTEHPESCRLPLAPGSFTGERAASSRCLEGPSPRITVLSRAAGQVPPGPGRGDPELLPTRGVAGREPPGLLAEGRRGGVPMVGDAALPLGQDLTLGEQGHRSPLSPGPLPDVERSHRPQQGEACRGAGAAGLQQASLACLPTRSSQMIGIQNSTPSPARKASCCHRYEEMSAPWLQTQ